MNEQTFHIGEKAILLPPNPGAMSLLSPRYSGTRVTILGELTSIREWTKLPVVEEFGHLIELHDGRLAWVASRILQKIPPGKHAPACDSDETPNAPAQFDPAIWQPSGVITV